MAIIYSYPEIPEVEGGDLLLISDTGAPNKPTRSVDIDDLAAYIGTVVGVVQNLQSVLTVGNTYVNANGYGTFTLNDTANDDGSITFVNPNEGWGYQISAEEGINITDGSGTNLMSIYSSGLSIRNGAQIMNIGTNALTATRNVYFPDASGTLVLTSDLADVVYSNQDTDISAEWTFYEDLLIDGSNLSFINNNNYRTDIAASTSLSSNISLTLPSSSGTIALTSDIPSPGPSGSGTTNYTARWTSASALGIGALYDNGTDVGIGINGTYANPPQRLTVVSDDDIQPVAQFKNIGNGGGLFVRTDSTTRPLLELFSGSSYRFVVKGTGDVGIGTTSPSQKLEVAGNIQVNGSNDSADGLHLKDRTFVAFSDASSVVSRFRSSAAGVFQFQDGSYNTNIVLNTNGNSYLNGGNVGIGTTSPSTKLHVQGGTSGYLFRVQGTSTLNVYDPGAAAEIGVGSGSGDKLKLFSNDSLNNGITIDTSGNIGIGTTSPAYRLSTQVASNDTYAYYVANSSGSNRGGIYVDSNGHTRFLGRTGSGTTVQISASGTSYLNGGNVGIGTTSPSNVLTIETDSNAKGIDFDAGGTRLGSIERMTIGSAVSIGLEGANGRPVSINNNHDSQVLIANGGGNVGVGTTSPSAKLHILGTTTLPSAGSSGGAAVFGNSSSTAYGLVLGTETSGKSYIQSQRNDGTATTYSLLIQPNGGNVGIGTTNPSEKLDVVGRIRGERFRTTTGGSASFAAYYFLGDSDTGTFQPANNTFGITTAGVERVRITDSGNIGIGTTSPGVKLDVNGQIRSNNQFLLQTGTTAIGSIRNQAGALDIRGDSSRDVSLGSVTSPQALFVEGTNGNVGIGTTSPAAELDVNGTARMDTGVTEGIHYVGSSVEHWGDGGTGMEFPANDTLSLRTASSDRLYINSSGNVGIGTTSPNAKLNVNGNVKIEGENELYFGGSGSVPSWEIKASGSDLVINDTGSNVGSVLFNNDEGVVLPRLTTTEINAISLPNTGLTVYNTTLNTLCFYNGSSWQKVSHANM